MKHFIAFAMLGIAAIGSGMALASHFSMPESRSMEPYRPAVAEMEPATTREVGMPSMPDMPKSLPDMSGSLPDMPRSLPDARGAMDGAGRAFGEATDTMGYYSDRAFGSTAMKVKRSVDQAKVPALN